ncbi:hypothetical protein F5Y17DRAFT_49209 [Xylariaceae sp. FL0594]|nr:hypothetical protein F5Y17DRAFT_49209 [Xylariaceae sp. FL0594]
MCLGARYLDRRLRRVLTDGEAVLLNRFYEIATYARDTYDKKEARAEIEERRFKEQDYRIYAGWEHWLCTTSKNLQLAIKRQVQLDKDEVKAGTVIFMALQLLRQLRILCKGERDGALDDVVKHLGGHPYWTWCGQTQNVYLTILTKPENGDWKPRFVVDAKLFMSSIQAKKGSDKANILVWEKPAPKDRQLDGLLLDLGNEEKVHKDTPNEALQMMHTYYINSPKAWATTKDSFAEDTWSNLEAD